MPYTKSFLSVYILLKQYARPTNIRGRVYIYASITPGDEDDFLRIKRKPGELPTGVLIGSVEIYNCTRKGNDYNWHLKNPKRLARPIRPKNHPQPVWFNPF